MIQGSAHVHSVPQGAQAARSPIAQSGLCFGGKFAVPRYRPFGRSQLSRVSQRLEALDGRVELAQARADLGVADAYELLEEREAVQ